ncbi:hypothetical protein MKW98_011291 [Papaver atlanticum]|uniref:Uncharacterized protein n=1 Tax=Papaver atlanticum TaxID=357466 RepID=A0AAD4SW32_9MAGN|nr:hypothetical protein MKW98_011291 [Papaver atlanticum]
MARSVNKFGVILLFLIASTVFSADKAQANFLKCMWECQEPAVTCWHHCTAESHLSPEEIHTLSEEAKHYAEPQSVHP